MEDINQSETTQEVAEPVQTEQAIETTNETVNADTGDVTTPIVEDKPVQSAEDNAKYASIRRESETNAQKRIDDHYNSLYGESNNVHTEAEYNQAIAKQEADEQAEAQAQQYKEAGVDPDIINQLINDNPLVKQANEVISQQKESARINSEVEELFAEFPESKDSKIPDSVFMDSINNGISLKYAYAMYANKNSATIAEQKTLRSLQQNAAASPGALNGDQAEKSDYSSMPTADFNKLIERSLRGERIKI